ncbi:hypothetical protein R1sor_013157 [Riccia sorocarpa]|uniref:Reverse transcriptase domain-containing protein n=1 Tax=Riccia sorocarpa TaxID=122646 RepID=A0ABD3H5W9_9MARC
MEVMGFQSEFINLVHGLVEGSVSKLHVNGTFSEEIRIERGVKQGCPLAPLLFAISTQPLMSILRKREAEGRLRGLPLTGNRNLLHNLYADDSGVMIQADLQNFNELQDAVQLYEDISGVKMNMSKTTVIPVAMDSSPTWLTAHGCYIAREGEVIRYLGFPIGWKVKPTEQSDYVLAKVQRRLGSWTYRMLTFAGRVTVVKHILRAIPIHILTCLTFSAKVLGKLEAICRGFVWGVNDQGQNRIPLIAWEDITQPKKDGGLQIESFQTQGQALRLKQLLRMFENPEEEWAWNQVRPRLKLHTEKIVTTGDTFCSVYLSIAQEAGILQQAEAQQIGKLLQRLKIKSIGYWMDWAWEQKPRRPLLQIEQLAADHGKLTPARYFLFTAALKSIWTERNKAVYEQRTIRIPIGVTLNQTMAMARAQAHGLPKTNKSFRSVQALVQYIENLIERAGNANEEEHPKAEIEAPTDQDEEHSLDEDDTRNRGSEAPPAEHEDHQAISEERERSFDPPELGGGH